MPGSRRSFTYTLTPAPGELERALKKATKILGWACDGEPRVECHGITGEVLGTITLNLTVVNKDQWACRQLAQDILNHVTWGISTEVTMDLISERFAPHTRRGYAHGRSKRRNEPRPKQPPWWQRLIDPEA